MIHRPRRVLVTGGAGFIGSNLVLRLLAIDAQVQITTLDKLTYAADASQLDGLDNGRHRLVVGDICDAQLVAQLLVDHTIDTILHLAAESHVDRSIDGPAAFVQTNVVGTYTLLDTARQVWQRGGMQEKLARSGQSVRFHHVSTDEVFGDLGPADPPFREDTPYQPSSPYSASKAASDHLVRAWARTYGLPVTLSNCSNNYGPRQHGEKLIPTAIRNCLARKPIGVYGKGDNVRDWLFVSDHADAIWHIVRHGCAGETYNVGGNNEWSNLALVRQICQVVAEISGCEPAELHNLIHFVTDRPGHDRRYAIDATKLEAIGWLPPTPFDLGLRQSVQWYCERFALAGLVDHGRMGLRAA
ncbi:MAG: dTDP-glucose 4,6-dehydratase [Myxococcales bacterium]|nr:dTDP-glucose 4,6-dehydratase [Myxococcales bacterium]